MFIPCSLDSGPCRRDGLLPADRVTPERADCPLLLLFPPVVLPVFLRPDPADEEVLFLVVPEEVFLLRDVPVFFAAILSSSLLRLYADNIYAIIFTA